MQVMFDFVNTDQVGPTFLSWNAINKWYELIIPLGSFIMLICDNSKQQLPLFSMFCQLSLPTFIPFSYKIKLTFTTREKEIFENV